MRSRYLEGVAPLGAVEPGKALVYMVGDDVYAPNYWLPHVALGHSAEGRIKVFAKNPGLRKIYSLFGSGECRYMVIAGKKPLAATPRSIFFYLFSKGVSSANILSTLLRSAEICLSHLVSVKTVIREMESRRSGFIPICKKGRITHVAAAPLLASYLDSGGRLSTRLASIKEYLETPPRADSIPQLLRIVKEYSHGVYEPEPGTQLFVSEHSLYEAARKILSKSLR